MEYAYNKKPMGRIARARISGVNASYKDLCEVCTNVRGKDTEYALNFLVDAAEMKKAILFQEQLLLATKGLLLQELTLTENLQSPLLIRQICS